MEFLKKMRLNYQSKEQINMFSYNATLLHLIIYIDHNDYLADFEFV